LGLPACSYSKESRKKKKRRGFVVEMIIQFKERTHLGMIVFDKVPHISKKKKTC
jgi:hypothetical protein